jgi:TatD DNase family protein
VTLVDSHCHLNYPGLVEDETGVLERARARGVAGFLNISTRQSEWADVIAAAERNADVWASIGVHPHEADQHADLGAEELIRTTANPRVVAIGECGLDYYYDKSDRAAQKERFRTHLEAAAATKLPVIIHTRAAEADTIEILKSAPEVTGVLHCFTGSRWLAEQGLALGYLVSLSGIITFRNAKDLQDTAKVVPDDMLLVETDSPFLAPVPNRGKTCEPAFVADTAAFVANLRGVTASTLAEQTSRNFYRLFTKASA